MSYQPHQSEDATLKPVAGSAPTGDAANELSPEQWLLHIVNLCHWDEDGATGPVTQGLTWESIGRMALDMAQAALRSHARLRSQGGAGLPEQPLGHLGSSVDSTVQTAREWQPIATAPKDGTRVLLYLGNDANAATSCGWWDDHKKCQCWIVGGYMRKIFPPTHWMPVPAPPQARNGTDNASPMPDEPGSVRASPGDQPCA